MQLCGRDAHTEKRMAINMHGAHHYSSGAPAHPSLSFYHPLSTCASGDESMKRASDGSGCAGAISIKSPFHPFRRINRAVCCPSRSVGGGKTHLWHTEDITMEALSVCARRPTDRHLEMRNKFARTGCGLNEESGRSV
jgi:hypothetical protein